MKAFAIAAAVVALAPCLALAQQPPPAPAYGTPVTEAQAEKIVQAAVAEAERLHFRMAISIVEPTGALVMFHKIDDTQYASIRISQESDLDEGIRAMMAHDGPVMVDCQVSKEANCFPMIPSGAAHTEMLLYGDMVAGTMDDEAKALV